jgi:GT2 family glycosyltransferase
LHGQKSDLQANPHDVLLLNDDAMLETPGGFTAMWHCSLNHREYGIIASTCNNVGNPNQFPRKPDQQVGLVEEKRMVCFVCVMIPRRTLKRVGGLDETFTAYGVEDDDYSLRVRKAGLKIGVLDTVFVDHGSLKSTFRGNPSAPADFGPNLLRYIAKHGEDNWGRKVAA